MIQLILCHADVTDNDMMHYHKIGKLANLKVLQLYLG